MWGDSFLVLSHSSQCLALPISLSPTFLILSPSHTWVWSCSWCRNSGTPRQPVWKRAASLFRKNISLCTICLYSGDYKMHLWVCLQVFLFLDPLMTSAAIPYSFNERDIYRKSEDKLSNIGCTGRGDAGSKLHKSRQELLRLVHQRLWLWGWPAEKPGSHIYVTFN